MDRPRTLIVVLTISALAEELAVDPGDVAVLAGWLLEGVDDGQQYEADLMQLTSLWCDAVVSSASRVVSTLYAEGCSVDAAYFHRRVGYLVGSGLGAAQESRG